MKEIWMSLAMCAYICRIVMSIKLWVLSRSIDWYNRNSVQAEARLEYAKNVNTRDAVM
jgi:hypothetical protein